jgi:hypothetical protein
MVRIYFGKPDQYLDVSYESLTVTEVFLIIQNNGNVTAQFRLDCIAGWSKQTKQPAVALAA